MTKESNWNECLENFSAIKVTPDNAKAKSLLDTAEGRIEFLNNINPDTNNANYIFEGFYSSAIEILHAKLIKKGIKVTNHICLGYYIRDIQSKNKLFKLFDDCRYKRNSLLYYGRKMDYETAIKAIKDCKNLINKLKETF